MNYYVVDILDFRQFRCIARFWMAADRNAWLNSHPAAKERYEPLDMPFAYEPGKIYQFPEV